MRWLFGLLALDAGLIAGWTIYRLYGGIEPFPIAEFGPLFVAAGVLVALLTLTLNRQRSQSEDYLEHAQAILEKAYTSLVVDDKGVPINKRLNWLTAARLVRTAEAVALKITEQSHKDIWKEELHYWRGRFHDLIFPNTEGFPSDYYAEKPEHMFAYGDDAREPLAMSSLTVLYRFIRWPEGHADPIRGVPRFTDEEKERFLNFGPRGLGDFLEKVDELAAKKPAA